TKPPVAISRRALGGEAPIVINEITDNCLYAGFFGILDSSRMKKVTDAILGIVDKSENDLMIVDLSNVEIIDSTIANHLKKLNQLLLFVGIEVIFCGIKAVVAQSMIAAGVQLENMTIEKNLKRALKLVFKRQGFKLVKIED
ncbi:MAG: STAS domain-containing protein, partial [Bacteroidota bacterium]